MTNHSSFENKQTMKWKKWNEIEIWNDLEQKQNFLNKKRIRLIRSNRAASHLVCLQHLHPFSFFYFQQG